MFLAGSLWGLVGSGGAIPKEASGTGKLSD